MGAFLTTSGPICGPAGPFDRTNDLESFCLFAESKIIMTTPNAAHSGTVSIAGDLTVNRLGFGAMRITGEGIWGNPKDPAECKRVLRRLLDLNVNFIDTADSYGPEVSENLIAEALHPYSKGLVIATKGGLTRQGPNKWTPVARAEYLRQCVEMSLRRLKVESIDLYQLHRFDPKVPVEESLGELKKMQEEGKIRHIGLSETTVADIRRAQKIVKVASVQNKYNITDRAYEDVVEYCEKNKVAFIPWFPLAAGELTKPGGVLDRIAHAHKASTSQVAIAWLLHRSPVMLPIPGTSKVKHLEENVATAELKLSDSERQSLEDAAKKAA
jgi:aryl-alcohol dehydrogenase-like predicted oxidoreductase